MYGIWKTKTVPSRLKTMLIAAVAFGVFYWLSGRLQVDKSPRELADAAGTMRLMTLLQVASALLFLYSPVAIFRFRRKWRNKQEAINHAGGVVISIAVPRDLGDDVRQETDFYRRLTSYLTREDDELPCPHIAMEVSATRDIVIYSIFIPHGPHADEASWHEASWHEGLELELREEITREWPGAQLLYMVKRPQDVPPTDSHKVFPDPAQLGQFGDKTPAVLWQTFKMAGQDFMPLYQDKGTGARGKDPVEAILGALSVIDTEMAMGVQFLIRPALTQVRDNWQGALQTREGRAQRFKEAKRPVPKAVERERKLIEERLESAVMIWDVVIRVWAASNNPKETQLHLKRLTRVILAQTRGKYNSLDLAESGQTAVVIAHRHFPMKGGMPLTGRELGRMMHLPSATVAKPYRKLYRAGSNRLPPDPRTIVREPAGHRIYATYDYDSGDTVSVGHPSEYARTHTFVAGRSGTGKSTSLANTVIQDFLNGAGGVVLDPHVDFIRAVIRAVPLHKLRDVIIFDVRDRQPPAYNVCMAARGMGATATVESLLGAVQVVMGANWEGAVRMQQILRNSLLLALGALGEQACILNVRKIVENDFYREGLLNRITDPIEFGTAMSFWEAYSRDWSDADKKAAIPVVIRRLEALTDKPLVRRSLGIPLNTINLPQELDSGRLILVPLHNSMGEEAKKLLGALLVRDFYNTMLMREAIDESERRNALLAMDEMGSFVGDLKGFVENLAAECRKYGAALVGATQFYSQMPRSVVQEVMENFSTHICYGGGPDYARVVTQIMGKDVTLSDVQNLPPFRAYVRPAIFGGIASPCLADMLPPVEPTWDEPYPKNKFHQKPPDEWQPLLPGAAPIDEIPGSPQDVPLPKLMATISRLSGKDRETAVDYVARLPQDVFEALLVTQRQVDAWQREEILHNPGLLRSDSVERLYTLSRLGWGIRSYMTDAMYIRDFYRNAGVGGRSFVSRSGSVAGLPADDVPMNEPVDDLEFEFDL